MDENVLPAVRLPTVPTSQGENGEINDKETPILDLPPANKFGFAWPTEQVLTEPKSHVLPAIDTQLDSSEVESSEGESASPQNSPPQAQAPNEQVVAPINADTSSTTTGPLPRLSRAFSMPLTTQLTHLNNPRRLLASPGEPSTPMIPKTSLNPSNFHELSLELADSVQMVIQTLLQISPPQLLDPAKEQFSACSLSIPSPSVSAMLTAMKNLNYMSANMSTLGSSHRDNGFPGSDDWSPPTPTTVQEDFDIGEMLQSVGDSLSGLAAQSGVDLVLFHADVGMKHVSVKGDECGISFALSHVVRQVLDTAQRGDTIEIGLFISTNDDRGRKWPSESHSSPPSSPGSLPSVPEGAGSLRCTFDIAHKFSLRDYNSVTEADPSSSSSLQYFDHRDKPQCDTQILRRLLRHTRATLKTDLQPRLFTPGRACELSLLVAPGSPSILTQPIQHSPIEELLPQPFGNANLRLASEPSLEELMLFAETLKGKKVALHASAKGSFAHHLTSYLTAWGLDVSHMTNFPVLDLDATPGAVGSILGNSSTALGEPYGPPLADSPAPLEQQDVNPIEAARPGVLPTFIIIDDDIAALRRRLLQQRAQAPYPLHPRQRPSLAANHRPRSSPQVARAKGGNASFLAQGPPVIVHFTSLANYKLVKDALQSVLATSPSSSNVIPEVIVLPKPAGPRRLLTALRTAVLKPVVDPFFSPIATSPMSPSIQGLGTPFFSTNPANKSPRPVIGARTNSDRSSKSSKEHVSEPTSLPPLPSPLSQPDAMEYFSEAAVQLGTSPSSGLVIQSPDGQPAGIYFHPRGTNLKLTKPTDNGGTAKSPPMIIRELSNLKPPTEYGRSYMQRRRPSDGESPERKSGFPPSMRPNITRHRSSLSYPPVTESTEVVSGEPSSSTPASGIKGKGRPSMSPRSDDRDGLHSKGASTVIPSAIPVPTGAKRTSDVGSFTSPPSAYARSSAGVASTADALLRKNASPPPSPLSPRIPGPATRRGSGRRTNMDSVTTGSGTKKTRPSESHIVPPISVLIVEDNPINQTILSTFMRRKKIKYDVAKNGEEAVAKWQTGSFHLILMDIQMPVMDGIDATKEIRRLEKINALNGYPPTPSDGPPTPSDIASTDSRASTNTVSTPFRSSVIIVALTASSLQSDRVAALAAGCNDFLTKPVSLLWLNNKIIEWGSIKALQMWADLRPQVAKSISNGQVEQAKNIASKLYVPEGRKSAEVSQAISRSASLSNPTTVADTPKIVETPGVETPKSAIASGPSPPVLIHAPTISTAPEPYVVLEESPKLINPETAGVEMPQQIESLDVNESRPAGGTDVENNIESNPSQQLTTEDASIHDDAVSASGQSSDTLNSQQPVRPSAPRVITSEDALLAHIKDTECEASNSAERDALERPTILGERAISAGNLSIAEVLHEDWSDEKANLPPAETRDAPIVTRQE